MSGSIHCNWDREICQVSGRDAVVEDHHKEFSKAVGVLRRSLKNNNKTNGFVNQQETILADESGWFLQELGDNWLKWFKNFLQFVLQVKSNS